jgi:hypothetical protein
MRTQQFVAFTFGYVTPPLISCMTPSTLFAADTPGSQIKQYHANNYRCHVAVLWRSNTAGDNVECNQGSR